jgi:hypothetical protein
MLLLIALLACGDKDVLPTDDSAAPQDSQPPEPVDGDGDGYLEDVDCDDGDAAVFPGAEELCDELDNDCDGKVDEPFDADGDGYYSAELCEHGDDCDDSIYSFNPGANEVPYNGVDEDCDGEDLRDVDGDGYEGVQVDGTDCEDDDASVYPGAEEVPKDEIDQDCDGVDLLDADGDGYDDQDWGGEDCDDEDPEVNPGAMDWLNDEIDADCDGRDGSPMDIEDAPVIIQPSVTSAQSLVGSGLAACDFDEDGLDDLVVGAPFASSYTGQVGVFYGSGYASWVSGMDITDADTLVSGGSTGSFFGFQPGCGDVDGDGHMDLVIQTGEIYYEYLGSPYYVTDFTVHIYYGRGTIWKANLYDYSADAELTFPMEINTSVGSVFSSEMKVQDLDGDGAAEILLHYGNSISDTYDGEERIVILPGNTYGDGSFEDEASHVLVPDQPYELSGLEVLSDLDGDGDPDIVVLANGYSTNWDEVLDTADTGLDDDEADLYGRAMFLPGVPDDGTRALADSVTASFEGQYDENSFGFQLVEGDFDCDGVDDLVISSSGDSSTLEASGGLWLFSAAGVDLANGLGMDPSSYADATVFGEQDGAYLGYALSNAGDVDGDGCEDLLVGAPAYAFTYDNGVTSSPDDVGLVYLLSGALLVGDIADVQDAAMLIWEGADVAFDTGSQVLATGDFDGDGESDFVIGESNWGSEYNSSGNLVTAGRTYVYLSSDR